MSNAVLKYNVFPFTAVWVLSTVFFTTPLNQFGIGENSYEWKAETLVEPHCIYVLWCESLERPLQRREIILKTWPRYIKLPIVAIRPTYGSTGVQWWALSPLSKKVLRLGKRLNPAQNSYTRLITRSVSLTTPMTQDPDLVSGCCTASAQHS